MTLLARAGVPGVVLWSIVLISWVGMHAERDAFRSRTRTRAMGRACSCSSSATPTSIIINATFDVTLEGPMQGIWFWCLFGFGIGSVMVYRAQHSDGIGAIAR